MHLRYIRVSSSNYLPLSHDMIITKTPYRVSLFGGGSDHPKWYRDNGGEVISFAIDKFCYITSRLLPPFFEHKYRVALQKYCPEDSIEISHAGDLPARSGIGSSSAFAVGLIHSLSLIKNLDFSQESLAQAAIDLEQNDLGENVWSSAFKLKRRNKELPTRPFPRTNTLFIYLCMAYSKTWADLSLILPIRSLKIHLV